MESYAAPFRALAASAGWFVRATEIRLMNVVTAPDLREATLQVLHAQEYHADNRSPFATLDEAFTRASPGWDLRAASIAAQHEKRRKVLARSRMNLASLGDERPPSQGAHSARNGIVPFAEMLGRAVHANCAPLEGLVVIVAPIEVDDAEAFETDLRALVETASLANVRWIVVDVDRSTLSGLVGRLGARAMTTEVRIDEQAVRADLARKIEGATNAPPAAPGPAQVGAAWPAVPPPRPPPPPPEAVAAFLAAAGAPAGMADPRMPQLRPLVLKAAAAMRNGSPMDAVRHQSEAVRLAKTLGLAREAAVMELVLATFVVHTGERDRATHIYATVTHESEQNEWFDLGAQALMATAALKLVDREREPASVLYAQAAAMAMRGKQIPIAIEAYRMAGQVRVELKDETQAVQLWAKAIEIAGGLPLPEAGQTSAPVAGRALAGLIRKRGLGAQAQSLEEQAGRMEAAAGGSHNAAAEA